MNSIEYKITSSFDDEVIYQTVSRKIEDKTKILNIYIIDTREKQVRDYLISIGWTPPDK